MRTVLLSLTLAVLAAGAGGCTAVLGGGRPAAPVLVGADLALTGTGSPLGTVFGNALRLRAAQLNRQGLLDGRRLELRLRDNRSDPQVAAANLAELAADPAVTAIVSGACGPCAAGAAARLDEHRTSTISLAAGDQVVEPVGQRRHLFQLGPRAGDDADLLATGLARAGAGTVGLVTTADAGYPGGGYGRAGLREMTAAADRTGLQIVLHEQVTVADPASAVAAAEAIARWRPDPPPGQPFSPPPGEASGPDAVVIWTPPAEAAQLATGLRQAGYPGELHLDAIAAGQLHLPDAALSGATLVFTDTPVADQLIAATPAAAARQTWFRDYLAQYGGYHAQASWAADAISLIVDAIRRTDLANPAGRRHPVDRDTLRDKLESTRRLDGLTGLIRYTADQHSGLHPGSLTTLTASAGRWHLTR
ncbi:MAG: ABC transporter substrate-binding protein [Micromonosporaceae bacterium]|nr:ABC transporter substrate-binding protein [Micromonosporaceae bacterium]